MPAVATGYGGGYVPCLYVVGAPLFFLLSQALANTAWALAKLEHADATLLRALAAACLSPRCVGELNAQNVSNLLHAAASLGVHPGGTLAAELCSMVHKLLKVTDCECMPPHAMQWGAVWHDRAGDAACVHAVQIWRTGFVLRLSGYSY